MAAIALALGAHAQDDPWADRVVDVNAINANVGFDQPQRVLGVPVGGGAFAPSNSDIHSIGTPGAAPGSFITVAFDTPVTDDPLNPMGLDLIVYSNVFWTGGNPEWKFVEPALIEISADTNGNGLADDAFFVIPGSRMVDASVLPEGIPNPSPPLAGNVVNPNGDGTEFDWGYAELTPTQQPYLDNYVRPDDPFTVGLTPRSGGGDAIDIAWAVDAGGAPANLAQIDFVRLSAFITGNTGFGPATPEIEALADVAPDVDSDGDGILDDYEIRVAGTDPARPESTVLALEIPREDGGSDAGTILGEAVDAAGNAIALTSDGPRGGVRDFNVTVDIAPVADPGPPIAGQLKSGAVVAFSASASDFTAAQVRPARFTMAYSSGAIAGLDESALAPYRFEGGAWTQTGIANVSRLPEDNLVTFESPVPGTYILASVAGSGDTGAQAGAILLQAAPVQVVANPANVIAVTGNDALFGDGSTVPDGTLFTVGAGLGTVTTPDADGAAPGVQVALAGGTLRFDVAAAEQAGTATLTAQTADGLVRGETAVTYVPGIAATPTEIFMRDPAAQPPAPIPFQTAQLEDQFGNVLRDGDVVTVAVAGGAPAGVDAAPAQPGFQVDVEAGVADFFVRVDTAAKRETATITVRVYGDAAQTVLVAQESFSFEVVSLGLPWGVLAAPALALAVAWRRRRARRRGQP